MEMKTELELLDIAIKDLVRISTLANNVIVKGSFPGYMSDEVNEVLSICKHVVATFTKEEENEEK